VDTDGDNYGDADADTNNDGEIQLSEAAAVTWLSFNSIQISSLVGIQSFVNLQNLSCRNNQLTNLNVQGLTNLWTLDCYNNQLTNLNVQGLTNLQALSCPYNQLTNLDVQGLTNLQTLYCNNNQLTNLDLQGSTNLNWLSCNNNQLTSIENIPNHIRSLDCHSNPIACLPFLTADSLTINVSNTNITCLPNIPAGLQHNTLPLCQANNANGCFAAARIYGNALKATNCIASSTILPNLLVAATNTVTNEQFIATTNNAGFYEIAVPLGTYTVAMLAPNTYWTACTNAATITITQSAQQANRDVGLNAVVNCADMTVNHAATTVMRPCSTAVLNVHYQNRGTELALGTYIELALAPELTFVSCALPTTPLGNNRFHIETGDIDFLQTGDFSVNVSVACTAVLGQQLCTDAEIFPHTYCNVPTAWDHSDLTVSGHCVGANQVRFIMQNTGTGAMTVPQTYRIIEDDVMIRGGQIQLAVGGSDSVTIAADPSRIYRIIVNETPNNPAGNTQESVLMWGCNGINSAMHWGFVNQFSLNSGNDFEHHLCTQVRTSFDPNDISAVATGTHAQHFILNDTELEYTIRFQNTGNDTAFVVRVLDMLPQELDKTTLQIGASSHAMTYKLNGNGVLEFLFQNIRLTDSTSNEAKSHGFVTYKIKTKANLATGTTINNQAQIYFDVNIPVATNIYTHTIGYPDQVFTATYEPSEVQIPVHISPNPTTGTLSVTLERFDESYMITVIDVLGQTVLTQKPTETTTLLNTENLPAGSYFIHLLGRNSKTFAKFIKL
jgi:uncharacterized repeat protein (TIGR01451 family)